MSKKANLKRGSIVVQEVRSIVKQIIENGDKAILHYKGFRNHININFSVMNVETSEAYHLKNEYQIDQLSFYMLNTVLRLDFENSCYIYMEDANPCEQIIIESKK